MSEPYAYLMAAPGGHCKVGFSTKPENRLRSLREAGHLDLRLVKVWQHKHAQAIETHALRILRPSRVSGEWISKPANEIADIIDSVIAKIDAGILKPSYRLRKLAGEILLPIGVAGNAASIASRNLRIQATIDAMRSEWMDESFRTADILERYSITYGVAKRYLGSRTKKGRAEFPSAVSEDFVAKKRSAEAGGGRKIGAAASVKVRTEDVARRIRLIEDDWPKPWPPTAELLHRAGRERKIGRKKVWVPMAYQTAVKALKISRPKAQVAFQASLAKAEANRKRRKKQ